MSASFQALKRLPYYQEPIKYREVSFSFSPRQVRLLNRWLKVVNRAAADIQVANSNAQNFRRYVPYYGALGGGLTFTFIPTGIGTVCTVKEYITGRTLDLSNLDEGDECY